MRRSFQLFFSGLIFFSFPNFFYAQCPITVDAGQDMFVCGPGELAPINGSVSGNFLDFNWTPTNGLDNPFSLTPNATVTGPAIYTLTAFAEDPTAPNLVNNPGFEGGNAGFTSNYTYDPTPITPGTYVITTSPALVFASFPPCDDHTFGNGTGNMMLCNGSGTPSDVWCQTIPVNPNTYYVMSGWITASPISPPEIQFSVNGLLVGTPFFSSGAPCGWEQFTATWFSDSSVSATVCVTDQNSSGNGLFGDDFALDDIYFAEACSVSDDVVVDIAEVDAVLPFTTILPCNALPGGITLDGSSSTSGPNISYQWDGASIVSGGNTHSATVNEPGTYTLTVTYDNGFISCSDMASIEVLSDPNFVLAFATVPNGLDCINTLVTLDGTGTFEGPTISYEWSPASGIVSGQNTLYPDVNQGGTYTLLVTNSITGCTATAEVTVDETIDNPTAIANSEGDFTCKDTVQILNANGSSIGNDFEYEWTVLNFGNIIFGENTIDTCVVDTAGTYQLMVTNIANGCTATDTIIVNEAFTLPEAVAEVGAELDCTNTTTSLSANGSSIGDSIIYLWTTQTGNIISGDSTFLALVDLAGEYLLTVTDTLSGCAAVDTAIVNGSSADIIAEAGAPVSIDCTGNPQTLNGTGSSTGGTIIYEWTTTSGNITAGNSTLTPTVSTPAIYYLTVTDTISGCFSTDSVLVSGNGNAPTVILEVSGILDCNNTTLLINGSGSTNGPNISINWSTTSGNIINGENTLTPEVDAPGTYTLTLIDGSNNCGSTLSIDVDQDTLTPTLSIQQPNELNCYFPLDTIIAFAFSQSNNYTLNWTTQNGNIIEGDTTLQPVVNAAGIYTLTVSNTENGCTDSDEVLILENFQSPNADAGEDGSLTCVANTLQLDGSASSQNGPYSYLWTTVIGNIVQGANTLNPTINQEGTYILEVTDTTNGCAANAGVSVNILTDFPQANINPADTLTCNFPTIDLFATASTGSIFQYLWDTNNGNILNGETSLTPTIDTPGEYILEVTDTTNGCTTADTILVVENINSPIAEAGDPFTLSCSLTEASLDGTGTSAGINFDYLWTSSNGNIISGNNSLAPVINAPGNYQLIVSNNSNGCTSMDFVDVFQDANAPIADAGSTDSLTCNTTNLILDGSASSTGNQFTYIWTTQDGNIVSNETTLSPQIDASGTYLLTVLDTSNNCQTLSSVQVLDATQGPTLTTIDTVLLTCIDTILTLSANAGNVDYLWSTINGNIVSGESTSSPLINLPGSYLVTATDQSTGCTATATSIVDQNTQLPNVNLQFPMPLTCAVDFVNISGWGSSSGPNFAYLWSTQNGAILGDDTQAQATASLPGNYTFTVSDLTNGCTASAQLTVVEDKVLPDAVANAPIQLGCGQTEVALDGSGSSVGNEFSYLWITQFGNILNGENTLSPVVDAPGEYLLIVTNTSSECSQTTSVILNEEGDLPEIDIVPPGILTCVTTDLTIDASSSTSGPDYSTIWTTSNGNIFTGEETLQPIIDAAGEYILTISNTQNGCSASDTISIISDTTVPVISAGPDLQLNCDDESVNLQGMLIAPQLVNSLWTYVPPAPGSPDDPFIGNPSDFNPEVDLPGSYILTVTIPSNGCTAVDQMTVSSITLDSFSFESTEPTCEIPTGSISFTGQQGGTPPYLYSVDGQTFLSQTVFDNLVAGPYSPSILDAAGCLLTENIGIQEFQPFQVIINPVSTTAAGEQVQLNTIITLPTSEIATITWMPEEGLSCTDCLDPFLLLTQDVSYTVEITDINGCSGTARIDISVSEPIVDVFVPNVFSPNNDGINDHLILFSKENIVSNIHAFRIFSRWGETVFERSNFPPNDFDYGWDGTHRGKLLDSAVFTWMAEIELVTGEMKLLTGDVVLLK